MARRTGGSSFRGVEARKDSGNSARRAVAKVSPRSNRGINRSIAARLSGA